MILAYKIPFLFGDLSFPRLTLMGVGAVWTCDLTILWALRVLMIFSSSQVGPALWQWRLPGIL